MMVGFNVIHVNVDKSMTLQTLVEPYNSPRVDLGIYCQ
jgi:hypothetical protein